MNNKRHREREKEKYENLIVDNKKVMNFISSSIAFFLSIFPSLL
jgi:hypothetical protein